MKLIKYSLFITTIVSTIILWSCGAKKTIEANGNLSKKTQSELLEDILSSEMKYNSIETKGNFKLIKGDNELKSSAVYKFIKDSILQISIRPILGTEFFRIDITPDSVFVLDRMKKQYAAEKYDGAYMLDNIDFNFYNLQALFTNQLFIPGKKDITKKDFEKYSISATTNTYLVQVKGRSNIAYNFAVDASDRIASTLVHDQKNNFTLQWSYSDFIQDNSYVYPTVMPVKVNAGKFRFDLEISYSKLNIDGNIKVDRSIPERYKKIGIPDFLESYLNKK